MDLLLIFRKIWRHKLATLPVIVLTICGMAYMVAVKSPVYSASGSYILMSPPAPPTPEQIARNPALGKIKSDNPYTRYSDPSVIIDVLSRTLQTSSARRELARAGAAPAYSIGSAAHFGGTSPIIQITAMAPSPQAAIHTAEVVGHAVVGELNRMQRVQNVDQRYWITAYPVDSPDGAQVQASGRLRSLVGVMAIGAILLFIVVSLADVADTLRAERRAKAGAVTEVGWPQDQRWSGGEGPEAHLSDLDSENWADFEDEALVADLSADFEPDPAGPRAASNGHSPSSLEARRRQQA